MTQEPIEFQTKYQAKKPDANGVIPYTPEEDSVWRDLYQRQIKIIEQRACKEYLAGLDKLQLTVDKVPQCHEVSKILQQETGWSVTPVEALIPFEEFFSLLSNRQFPAASFIRTREELDYLQEPDIFHEIFGHCPLLTNPVYADFVYAYGKLGLAANEKDRSLLARLFWFTIEFGLIQADDSIKVYGAGILSSKEETVYSLESPIPRRKPFNALETLRTPYRHDIMQPLYFIIQDFAEIYDLLKTDMQGLMAKAQQLGEHPLVYPDHAC